MPSLLELQRCMRATLLAGTDTPPPPTALGGGLAAAARVGVYRNNVLRNLTDALRLSFPAIERLVGTDFFAAAAACFIRATPPTSADLYDYGAVFPSFLAAFGPAQGLAYLPDVARLEWAVNVALHAPFAPSLAVDALLSLPEQEQAGLRFVAHPSLSLLALAHPAKAIWEAVLTEDSETRASALAAIDIEATGDVLAVRYGADGLTLLDLSTTAYDLARALIDGHTLADALDLVPPEEAAPLLGGFFMHGFLCRGDLPETPSQTLPFSDN